MEAKNNFKDIFKNYNKPINNTIIFLTIILFIYCYFGTFSFFDKYFSYVADYQYWSIIFHNCSAFVLFFGFGLLWTKLVQKQSLKEIGLRKGNWKLGLILCAIATVVVPLLALSTVLDSGMTSTYPLIDFNTYGTWYYLLGYFASYILYYVGWEFLFRGIGLFNLEKGGISPLGAILIITFISALIHTSIGGFGKPMIETLSAIPAGLIFGYITYKTKSIYYSLYIHALVGILTDVFIFLIVLS